MIKNHVKKTITDGLWDSYFQLGSNQINSILDLTTVVANLEKPKG
jgi:hypothetical protein